MNRWMLSEPVYHQLVINHAKQMPLKGSAGEIDFEPVVRLHIPFTDMQWILTELDPEDGIAFGLCQIQMAELGSVWMPELAEIEVQGLRVIEDRAWTPKGTLRWYAERSRANGWMIVE